MKMGDGQRHDQRHSKPRSRMDIIIILHWTDYEFMISFGIFCCKPTATSNMRNENRAYCVSKQRNLRAKFASFVTGIVVYLHSVSRGELVNNNNAVREHTARAPNLVI